MRITFQRQGGGVVGYVPGLSQPVVIDTDQLAAAQRTELERLVQTASFFALPATVGMKRRGTDLPEYTVTVEDADRSSTVRFIEPFDNEAIEALIAVLESHAQARRP